LTIYIFSLVLFQTIVLSKEMVTSKPAVLYRTVQVNDEKKDSTKGTTASCQNSAKKWHTPPISDANDGVDTPLNAECSHVHYGVRSHRTASYATSSRLMVVCLPPAAAGGGRAAGRVAATADVSASLAK